MCEVSGSKTAEEKVIKKKGITGTGIKCGWRI